MKRAFELVGYAGRVVLALPIMAALLFLALIGLGTEEW